MSVVSVFNQKGGSGKTMLSVHLAVAAYLKGLKVLILDLDEQGSALNWYRVRMAAGDVPGPVVAKVHIVSLDRAIAAAIGEGFDLILIDCPPAVSPATAKMIGAAGLVLIPITPEPFDLAALPATLVLVGAKRYAFVLSNCPKKAPEIEETREILLKMNKPVYGPVNNWVSMWRSVIGGKSICEFKPRSKAAKEIKAVCNDILKEMQ